MAIKIDLYVCSLLIYIYISGCLGIIIPKLLTAKVRDLKMFVGLKLPRHSSLLGSSRKLFCASVVRVGT